MKTRMKIKDLELCFFILGILLISSSASVNDWELQGENQWNYDPSLTFNAGPVNNNQGYPQQNQNQFNPGDSQQKDSGPWDNGRTQQPGRTWNQQDAQIKEGDERNNNQRGRGSWNPADSQVKDSSGGTSNQGWSANDGQVKDTSFGGNNQGNFGPSDAQWKEEGTWSNRRNQGGQQGRGTGSRPGLNQGNDISNRNFGPNDAQRRGSWNTNGRGRPGGWTPDDSQVKDDGIAGGNKQWNVGDEQIKVTPAWDQGVSHQPTDGGRDTNVGTRPGWTPGNQGSSEIPGNSYVPPVEGPAPGRNEGFPNQGLPQDNINRPGELPGIIESNLRGDDGTTGNDYGPMDQGVTVPGIDGFPANDGRVPQGNYKGGDTGSYPGDDPSQWRLEDSIPGTPGVDYPNYSTIPATGFDCKQHENPGYYGDVEAQCQVFHICQADGRHDAFLCPLGTIFRQQYFVCVWWFNFNCEDTPMYYELNADLYKGGHGGQGNFKGDAYPGSSTGGDTNNAFTTPPTGNVEILGGPDYGPGVNRGGVPNQDTRPVGDRGVPAAPDSGFSGNRGQTQQGGSIRPGGSVTSVPQSGNEGATDRPTIEKPEVWIGTGPGTGVTVPQGGSVGFKPNVGGKTNQQSGKRNWSPNQGNDGNWNNAVGNRGNDAPGQTGPNRGVKGGNWGNNAGGLKSRVWEGTENQQQINFEKRWGSGVIESFEGEGATWDSQKDGSSGNNNPIRLNREHLPDSEEPFWNQNPLEYEDVLGAGTNLHSSTEKLENEHSQASNVKTVLTKSQEIPAKNGKNPKRYTSKKNGDDVLSSKGKKLGKNGNIKWWKDAKITNILFKNSQNATPLNVTQTKQESTAVQFQDLKSEDTFLHSQNGNFDLNRDYTSDKNSKQKIWTLL